MRYMNALSDQLLSVLICECLYLKSLTIKPESKAELKPKFPPIFALEIADGRLFVTSSCCVTVTDILG